MKRIGEVLASVVSIRVRLHLSAISFLSFFCFLMICVPVGFSWSLDKWNCLDPWAGRPDTCLSVPVLGRCGGWSASKRTLHVCVHVFAGTHVYACVRAGIFS